MDTDAGMDGSVDCGLGMSGSKSEAFTGLEAICSCSSAVGRAVMPGKGSGCAIGEVSGLAVDGSSVGTIIGGLAARAVVIM